jgi:hypothetical protein
MFISKNSKWKWWFLWGCDNLENVFAIRICSREPGQHILVEQCLVGVAVTSANCRTELTLFFVTHHNTVVHYFFAGTFEKGLTCKFSST